MDRVFLLIIIVALATLIAAVMFLAAGDMPRVHAEFVYAIRGGKIPN